MTFQVRIEGLFENFEESLVKSVLEKYNAQSSCALKRHKDAARIKQDK